MSNFLAISTVTATLQKKLQSVLDVDMPGALVTTNRPEDPGSNTRPMGLNIYLYQVNNNSVWRNADLPTRRDNGSLVQRPQVALDLHYLFSFYGNEGDLETQRLLGSVTRTMHAYPILSRMAITGTVADPDYNYLVGSDLADAIASVKFSPLHLSLEELSKLWSVFFQVPYTLSVAYQGTVILIESPDVPQPSLTVRDYNIYPVPFALPVIEKVSSLNGPRVPVDATSTLKIVGRKLKGDSTRVMFGGEVLVPDPTAVGKTEIRLPLTLMPAGILRSGIHGVQVVHELLMGSPPVSHHGFASNVAAVVLHPIVADLTLSGGNFVARINPIIGPRQQVQLLLNEFNPPPNRSPRSYMLAARPHRGTASDSIVFSMANTDPAIGELGLDNPAQVAGILSGDLSGFAGLTNDSARVLVTMGDEGPHQVSIEGAPSNLSNLRSALQNGIRAAHGSTGFTTAQVIRIDKRFLVLSGKAGDMISFSPAGEDPAISEMGLVAPDHVSGVLSANLSGFGGLTNDPAAVRAKIGDQGPHEVTLGGNPASLSAARTALQNGLQSAHSSTVFTGARVILSANRLLVIHGAKQIAFSGSGVVPGDYLFRLQVDGAISTLQADNSGRYIGPTVTVP
jgi:hypothetical protein